MSRFAFGNDCKAETIIIHCIKLFDLLNLIEINRMQSNASASSSRIVGNTCKNLLNTEFVLALLT